MPTLTQARPRKSGFVIPADLEEAEYPPEVIEKWNKTFEKAKRQLATGELRPMTVEEYAAKRGIRLNG
jgi:hypothetical protein